MARAGPSCLYCDTDSVVWLESPASVGGHPPPLRPSLTPTLGQLLSEVQDEDVNPIREFLALGSKSSV
jgi:hypothetical protein